MLANLPYRLTAVAEIFRSIGPPLSHLTRRTRGIARSFLSCSCGWERPVLLKQIPATPCHPGLLSIKLKQRYRGPGAFIHDGHQHSLCKWSWVRAESTFSNPNVRASTDDRRDPPIQTLADTEEIMNRQVFLYPAFKKYGLR